MNEQIKELAARAEKLSLQYANKNNVNFVDAFNIVFAELIVLECANVIENSPWKLGNSYKATDQAWLIKEHFGVEE